MKTKKHITQTTIIVSCMLLLPLLQSCQDDEEQNQQTTVQSALIIATDYESGTYATISLEDLQITEAINAIHQDAVCRFDSITGYPYIIARLGADAIDVIDPYDDWQIKNEYSVEAGTNAQDIAVVSEERAYVARLGSADLLIVDPITGTELGKVDLSAYADNDGLPEAAWLYHIDGEVFVLLQRLESYVPSDYSNLVILDAANGTIKEALQLTATNPIGKLRYNKALEQLVIVEVGAFGTLDGGIEYFDPSDHSLSGLVIDEEELGGDLIDAVIVSENKGYAVIGTMATDAYITKLLSFNPSTGTLIKSVLEADDYDYLFLALTPDGSELWLADGNITNPGVRIFDTSDDQEMTEAPLNVGLPPSMICFIEYTE